MGKKSPRSSNLDSPHPEFSSDYHERQEPLFSSGTLLGDVAMVGLGARAFARRRRMGMSQTQELVQQTLFQAWRCRAKFLPEPNRARGPRVLAWSRKMAEREHLHDHRKKLPAICSDLPNEAGLLEGNVDPRTTSPLEQMIVADEVRRAWRAARKLTPALWTAFVRLWDECHDLPVSGGEERDSSVRGAKCRMLAALRSCLEIEADAGAA